MSRQIQSLLNAVQFMTLVPTPRTAQFDDDWLLSASKYFPLVGAGIGLVCGGVLLAGSLIWSGVVPAMMAVAAGRRSPARYTKTASPTQLTACSAAARASSAWR